VISNQSAATNELLLDQDATSVMLTDAACGVSNITSITFNK
jgi:hypothetical protein